MKISYCKQWENLFSEFLAELQTQIQEIYDYADDHADVEQQRYTDQYNKKVVNKHFKFGLQIEHIEYWHYTF